MSAPIPLDRDFDATSIASVLASDDTTSTFFQEELNQLPPPRTSDSVSLATVATSRTARGLSLSRFSLGIRRSGTELSKDTILVTEEVQTFTLEQFCDFIHRHPSLRSAGIESCSCYSEPSRLRFIPHRFLVLEISRNGRRNVWLRLDRRPSDVLRLAFGLGETTANDTVLLASSRDKLLPACPGIVEESRLVFPSPGSLLDLRQQLLDIVTIMSRYKLTSENCWAFCWLLMNFFRLHENARVELGQLKYPEIAPKAAEQVQELQNARHSEKLQLLWEEARQHQGFHDQMAPLLSKHDPSSYKPFSVLLHALRWPNDKAVEAARRWEKSDGFSSLEGQLLARKLIQHLSSMEENSLILYQAVSPQFAFQTTALCCQVMIYARLQAEASSNCDWRTTVDPRVCRGCIQLVYMHGLYYLQRLKFKAALPLFEEATSLLIPGVIKNWRVCSLNYYLAITLDELAREDEARVVVGAFIECVRHEYLHAWRAKMEYLRVRGIWNVEFNYLLELKDGDLPDWNYWREDQSGSSPRSSRTPSAPSLLSTPSSSTAASTSTSTSMSTLISSNSSDSLSRPSQKAEHSNSSIPLSLIGDDTRAEDPASGDGVRVIRPDDEVRSESGVHNARDGEDAKSPSFSIEVS